jgi:hypothetical protein
MAPQNTAASSASPAPPSASADPAATEKLGVFDDSDADKPDGGVAFIGPGVRSGQVVTVELFVVLVTPSSAVRGLEGHDVSYLRATVRYDCVARTRQALTMTVVDPTGASAQVPVPGAASKTVAVAPGSNDLSDAALPFACGSSAVKATVTGIGEALAYARRTRAPAAEPPAAGSGDRPGP